MNKFKPCPFCGCRVPPDQKGNGIGDNWLECTECGASTRLREDGAGSEKDWNRRAARATAEQSEPVSIPAIFYNGDTKRDPVLRAACDEQVRSSMATARAHRDSVIEQCCAAIKAEDDRMSDEDYMLDSDDCIRVCRALKSQQDAAIESQRSGDGS